MQKYDVAVIGGGAAGMMAAITASDSKKRVVLIEKNPILGRKILATGNGRCNITNKFTNTDRYHGAKPEFIASILDQFDQTKTINFFQDLGLLLKEEDNGRMFPRTNQASSIIKVLTDKLQENQVRVLLGDSVTSIDKGFNLTLASGASVQTDKLIVTTGGKASHFLGSSGDGYFWAKNLGHSVTPIYAALVPLETVEKWPKDIQGIKVEAKVSIFSDGKIISQKSGDLLFTHFGVSGPAVMSQARVIAPLIGKSKVTLSIDLFSDLSFPELDKMVASVFEKNGKKTVKNALIGILPEKMISLILKLSDVTGDKKAAEISKSQREKIIQSMKSLVLTVSALRPLKEAQVTSGGVECREIDSDTLESKIVKNLFFAGEILDVDGDSGGFNLQWAWSSGYVAGKNSSK